MNSRAPTKAALFSDNSMEKRAIQSRKQTKRLVYLKETITRVSARTAGLKQRIVLTKTKRKIAENANRRLIFDITNSLKMNSAALVIQSAVKKWLYERASPDKSFTVLEAKLELLLQELELRADFCLWNLGNALEDSVVKIQAAFRRSKFRSKLTRLRNVYHSLKKQKKSFITSKVLKYITILCCKFNSHQAKKQKSLQHRRQTLESIRKRLALITISIYWKAHIHSYKILRSKIKRYRMKQLRSHLNRTNTFNFSKFSSVASTPHNELESGERKLIDFAKIAEEKMRQDYEQKLESSLVSYQIKKFQFKIIEPLRQNLLNPFGNLKNNSTKTMMPVISEYSKPHTPRETSTRKPSLNSTSFMKTHIKKHRRSSYDQQAQPLSLYHYYNLPN